MPDRAFGRFDRYSSAQFARKLGDRGGRIVAKGIESDQRSEEHTVAQFIYTMRKVRKAVGDKLILDDVTLSFLPGAKIGVVGPNGAGKSTVLRIMAGLDQPSNGDAQLSPGY